jgi:hypothetical protein
MKPWSFEGNDLGPIFFLAAVSPSFAKASEGILLRVHVSAKSSEARQREAGWCRLRETYKGG